MRKYEPPRIIEYAELLKKATNKVEELSARISILPLPVPELRDISIDRITPFAAPRVFPLLEDYLKSFVVVDANEGRPPKKKKGHIKKKKKKLEAKPKLDGKAANRKKRK